MKIQAFGPHNSEHLHVGKQRNWMCFPACVQLPPPVDTPASPLSSGKSACPGGLCPFHGGASPLPSTPLAAGRARTQTAAVRLPCASLAQAFLPQDCLGLPSSLTAALCLGRHTPWMGFPIFNLFSGWVLLCNHRLSSKRWRGSHSKQVGLRRWGRTHRPPNGPWHLSWEAPGSGRCPGYRSLGGPLLAPLTHSQALQTRLRRRQSSPKRA